MSALASGLRQMFCVHDWSCKWSRACQGDDHYCLRCGTTTTRKARARRGDA